MNIEEKIESLLSELSFANSWDADYFHSDYVILFSKDDNYKLEGKTNGLLSHSLKHLYEFEPQLVKSLLRKAVTIIIKASKYYVYKQGVGFLDSNLPKVTDGMIINTLDSIQDKVMKKEKLNDIELELQQKVLKDFYNAYQHIIDKILNSAVDIKDENSNNIAEILRAGRYIKIPVENRDIYLINTKENVMLVINAQNQVATVYKAEKGKAHLYGKIRKALPLNRNVLQAINLV